MTPLLVATRSGGKQREFRRLLAPLDRQIVFPDEIGLSYHPSEEEIEVHASFEANARAKAHWFRDRSGLDTVADDSGLEVDALDGAPGVHSKRMAGCTGTEEQVAAANIAELLRRLAGRPEADRTAAYRCVLVLAHADRRAGDLVASGSLPGRILERRLGEQGFGYDPVFWSDDLADSLGRVSAAAKDGISHRLRAVAALMAQLASPTRSG